MHARQFAPLTALAIALGSALSLVVELQAQAPPATTKPFMPPPASYAPPKTPWGDPDLQGVWDYQSLLNVERPRSLGMKKTLTDAEFAEFLKSGGARENALSTESSERQGGVAAYNEFWNNRKFVKDNRTSLLEDPPDGRFPPLTPEAEKRRQEILKHYGGDVWDTWEDAHPLTRCIASQTPNGPMMYNSGTYIMQTSEWVLIVRERLDTRIIALDRRSHIGAGIHEWNGDSVGHWEGNVLVVDTTNFTDKQKGGRASGTTVPPGIPFGNFHLTERFVLVSPTRIEYYATVEDPTTWTKPWTIMIPWAREPNYTIFEYACHEGNISVGNAMRGERLREAKEAAAKDQKK